MPAIKRPCFRLAAGPSFTDLPDTAKALDMGTKLRSCEAIAVSCSEDWNESRARP